MERLQEVMDILDKMNFFQGQRAGRELWNDKPIEVQEEDLENFKRDINTIGSYIWDIVKELKQYRDAEEQGLLLRLPCRVGTVVWNIDHIYECKHAYNCPLEFDNYKCEANVPCRHEYKVLRVKETVFNYKMLESIGNTVFLTKEEAEQALAKMKEV
jgi:hypothetical protein